MLCYLVCVDTWQCLLPVVLWQAALTALAVGYEGRVSELRSQAAADVRAARQQADSQLQQLAATHAAAMRELEEQLTAVTAAVAGSVADAAASSTTVNAVMAGAMADAAVAGAAGVKAALADAAEASSVVGAEGGDQSAAADTDGPGVAPGVADAAGGGEGALAGVQVRLQGLVAAVAEAGAARAERGRERQGARAVEREGLVAAVEAAEGALADESREGRARQEEAAAEVARLQVSLAQTLAERVVHHTVLHWLEARVWKWGGQE